MNKAIVLGCSHAAGAEIDQVDEMQGYLMSYPALIAQRAGYQVENHAMYGGSNDSIFRIFIDQLPRISVGDIVIACWTGPTRTEIYHELHDQWIQITPNSNRFNLREKNELALQGHFIDQSIDQESQYVEYTQYWQRLVLDIHGISAKLNKTKNVLSLNDIALAKKITVLNFYSFDSGCDDFTDRFCWPMGKQDFVSWCQKNNYQPSPKNHYGKDAHRDFADQALQNTRINYP